MFWFLLVRVKLSSQWLSNSFCLKLLIYFCLSISKFSRLLSVLNICAASPCEIKTLLSRVVSLQLESVEVKHTQLNPWFCSHSLIYGLYDNSRLVQTGHKLQSDVWWRSFDFNCSSSGSYLKVWAEEKMYEKIWGEKPVTVKRWCINTMKSFNSSSGCSGCLLKC